jgi:hypothetical protein
MRASMRPVSVVAPSNLPGTAKHAARGLSRYIAGICLCFAATHHMFINSAHNLHRRCETAKGNPVECSVAAVVGPISYLHLFAPDGSPQPHGDYEKNIINFLIPFLKACIGWSSLAATGQSRAGPLLKPAKHRTPLGSY